MKSMYVFLVLLLAAVVIAGCGTGAVKSKAATDTVQAELDKFAPVTLSYDAALLDSTETAALKKIVAAAKYMDQIFLTQVYAENEAIRAELKDGTPHAALFDVMVGPFNRLDEDAPFINKAEKPDGANFYPEDMTKEELLEFVEANPALKDTMEHVFTRIVRDDSSQLTAVAYSEAYKQWLEPAAQLLNEAAELTQNASLKKYLQSRAAAFSSNDYYQSDMDWMDLDSEIEVVIGPYEVYEDKMFNYKAAFEAFVTIVDPIESEKLAIVGNHLDDLERSLPIPNKYKNFDRGSSSPIKVVQEVFSAGDTKAGVQTLAFNLPNDERVRQAKGSKKVMLKNVAEAKFNQIYTPIAAMALKDEDLAKTSFDVWFTHILMHETTHGLGPGFLKLPDGTETTVGKVLKETYSAIEECKADVGGMYTFSVMCNNGIFPKEWEESIYPTFLGGIFRSVRFGAEEAHGKANLIAFNYIAEKGGWVYDEAAEKFHVDLFSVREAVRSLVHDLLVLQAEGDYEAAKAMIEKYGDTPESMKTVLAKLVHVPVDIRPEFEVLKSL